jgi:hypothetical protein
VSPPAIEIYRVERDVDTNPVGKRHMGLRAVGTALTGLPMPSSKPKFNATLRILDASNAVVFEKEADQGAIDALELQILSDLVRLDAEEFRQSYGLPETTPDA